MMCHITSSGQSLVFKGNKGIPRDFYIYKCYPANVLLVLTNLLIYVTIGDLQESARHCTHEADSGTEGDTSSA